MIQITKLVVTRDEIMFIFSLERVFMDRWSGDEVERVYADAVRQKKPSIPPMPRIEGMGKSTRSHVATVEAWLLKFFQKGGEEPDPKLR